MREQNKKRILVVEDDEDISFAVSLLLEGTGYDVTTANNGRCALEQIEKAGIPDLILLDMRMPEMTGWEFSKTFRIKYGRAAPIVAMTAAGDAQKWAQDVEALGWVEKPFDMKTLLDQIERLT